MYRDEIKKAILHYVRGRAVEDARLDAERTGTEMSRAAVIKSAYDYVDNHLYVKVIEHLEGRPCDASFSDAACVYAMDAKSFFGALWAEAK